MVLITVITICFNNLGEMVNTCRSVDRQNQKPFEHLIIDGSTNADIANYLQRNTQPIYRQWIIERDNGIADAFNKGINNSSGDVVVMLNSGDAFFDEHTIKVVVEKFTSNPSIQWLHGKYKITRSNVPVIIGKSFEKKKLYRGMRSVCHQTMFVRKVLHDKFGLYDTDQKLSMDYDFLCRIKDQPFAFVAQPLVIFSPLGLSSAQYLLGLKFSKIIYEKYFGASIRLRLWQLRLRMLYYLLGSPIGNILYKIKINFKLENM